MDMEIHTGRAQIASAIKPENIWLADFGHPLVGTLESYEFERQAACFVHLSQEAGYWTSVISDERIHPQGIHALMVKRGLLSEIESGDGRWIYGLTSFTIEQIYRVQSEATIAQLQARLRRAQDESVFSRIKRSLREVLALTSPSS